MIIIGKYIEQVSPAILAQDVGAVPQGIKEQRPGRLAVAFVGPGMEPGKQAFDGTRAADFANPWLGCNQGPQIASLGGNPFSNRHGETPFA